MNKYNDLLLFHFNEIIKQKSKEILDISSKNKILLDLKNSSVVLNDSFKIIKAHILEDETIVGEFKLIIDSEMNIIDEFFIINYNE